MGVDDGRKAAHRGGENLEFNMTLLTFVAKEKRYDRNDSTNRRLLSLVKT